MLLGTSKELIGHTFKVYSVAFAPDSNVLFSTGWNGVRKIWDVKTGQEIQASPVESGSRLQHGRINVAIAGDGWVSRDGERKMFWLPVSLRGNRVAVSDDSKFMVIGSYHGKVVILDLFAM